MKPKMQSAIEKITLNDATFTGEVIEPTFVNFFYGKNGAGKSTIARTIKSNSEVEWQSGKSASDYDVLVYDTDFVNANFANYDNLAGVFTVCETNIEVQKQLEKLAEQKKQKGEEYKQAKETADKKQGEKDTALIEYQEECWKQTEKMRVVFDAVITGKKKKALFAEEILAITPVDHDFSELESTVNTIFHGDDKKYAVYAKAGKATYASLPGYELMGKAIASSSETPFASFIKALNATDWVRQGHSHYAGQTDGKCPYCQQKLPEDFDQDIAACFDAQYQSDIAEITKFQSVYKSEMDSILKTLQGNLGEIMPGLNIEPYQTKLKMLQDAITINNQRIAAKVKEPTTIASLEDIDTLLLDIGAIIDKLNAQISARNNIVSDIKNQKIKCKKEVWEYLAYVLKDVVKTYRDTITKISVDVSALNTQMKTLIVEGKQLNIDIADLNKQVVNTEAAIEGINRIIRTSGFQGFSLKAKEGVQNTYEVIRPDGSIAEKLSEGERNFIAFLYFYHLVKGSYSSDEVKEKIVVIDDPVSSMDSGALFIVSALVREMIEVCYNNTDYRSQKVDGDYIKQIFILTHNVYFHKEITHHQVKRYRSVSFYLIRKTDNVSEIILCVKKSQTVPTEIENYNPIQNSYAALWDEYRELKTVNTLTNVIRRILEYYFIQLCGYDGNDLVKIVLEDNKEKFIDYEEGKKTNYDRYHLASALLSYINESPAIISDGLNFVEDGTDVEQYKTVFKLIFEAMQQEQHYKMMMNIEEEVEHE